MKYYFFILFITLFSCKSNDYDQNLVQQEVDRQVKKYMEKHIMQCRQRALSQASAEVDSFLTANPTFWKTTTDTILFPTRPTKPTKTEVISALDTMAVRPLFPIRKK